jgi:hypothetical protein
MKIIKNILSLFALIIGGVFFTFSLTGCYTVMWSPDQSSQAQQDDPNDAYYDNTYYGDYYNYYDVPWWRSIPAVTSSETGNTIRNKQSEDLRNSEGFDRSTPSRLQAPNSSIPTRSSNSSNSSTVNSSKVESSNSGNSQSNDNRNSSNAGSNSNSRDSNNNTRNNNGDRNDGGRH